MGVRILVHGMQSSGATAFTLFLAQRPDCLALVDVANNFAAPRVDTDLDMVVKVVVTTAYALDEHVERFRPDRTILFLRDPRDNFESLRTKHYRNYSGLVEEKFELLETLFRDRAQYDAVFHYEDFVARDSRISTEMARLGWPVAEDSWTYRRRHDEMLAALWAHVPGLMDRIEFVFGNVQGREVSAHHRQKPRDPATDALLERLCPELLESYRVRDAAANTGRREPHCIPR